MYGAVTLLALCLLSSDEQIDRLLDAIAVVESRNNDQAVGDGGRSIGRYQIQRAYWKDSRTPGRYDDVRLPLYARQVIRNYWSRYAGESLRSGDLETLARIHNGGPAGARRTATVKYWNRIRKELTR